MLKRETQSTDLCPSPATLQGNLGAGPGIKAAAPVVQPVAKPAPAAANGAATAGGALADYQSLLTSSLEKAVDAAEAIGGEVLKATRVLAEGFRREAVVVAAMQSCQASSPAARAAAFSTALRCAGTSQRRRPAPLAAASCRQPAVGVPTAPAAVCEREG